MARDRRFTVPRAAEIGLVWILLVVFAIALLATGWQLIGDAHGATVDAEVVSITTNGAGRRVYDIRLVTRSGRTCVTEVDSGSNPRPREIRVGGTSRVHYSSHSTCAEDSVRESTSSSPEPFVTALSLAVAGCLLQLWRLRRNRKRIP
jgi:hypothetical protein